MSYHVMMFLTFFDHRTIAFSSFQLSLQTFLLRLGGLSGVQLTSMALLLAAQPLLQQLRLATGFVEGCLEIATFLRRRSLEVGTRLFFDGVPPFAALEVHKMNQNEPNKSIGLIWSYCDCIIKSCICFRNLQNLVSRLFQSFRACSSWALRALSSSSYRVFFPTVSRRRDSLCEAASLPEQR